MTKIELENPFKKDFKAAYLNTNKEPRRVVSLIMKNGKRTSMSYARYLMCCHLNRFLKKEEHVDHIDNNKLNDCIENIQILSAKENNIKKNKNLGIKLEEDIEMNCPICGIKFKRPARNIKFKIKNGKNPTCSRKCGGIMSHLTKNK